MPAIKRINIGFVMGRINKVGTSAHLAWSGVIDTASKYKINIFCYTGRYLQKSGHYRQPNIIYEQINSSKLDGLVVWTPFLIRQADKKAVSDFFQRFSHIPVISAGLKIDGLPAVTSKMKEGMEEVLRHLIEDHGYKRIAFIKGEGMDPEIEIRYQAYLDMLKKYSLPLDPDLVFIIRNVIKQRESLTDFVIKHCKNTSNKIDAVIASIAGVTPPFLEILNELNIKVPEQVAIAGVGQTLQVISFTPAVTTIQRPYYDISRMAVEKLLEMINGKSVPEITELEEEISIQQTCGCSQQTLLNLHSNGYIIHKSDKVTVSDRNSILKKIRELSGFDKNRHWAEIIVDSLMAEIANESSHRFLSELNDILYEVEGAGENFDNWQDIISVLMFNIIPQLNDKSQIIRIENLLHQARLMVSEMMKRVRTLQLRQNYIRRWQVQRLNSRLITSFNIPDLVNVLTNHLPNIEIPSAYMSLYENPQTYTGPESVPEYSRLMVAYVDKKPLSIREGGEVYPTRQLLPDKVLPRNRSFVLIALNLYFEDNQLGFVVFELTVKDIGFYNLLQINISSALEGAKLMQKLKKANDEIQHLNKELKKENIRMSSELEVVKQLQRIILPSDREIKDIRELQIATYMEPAVEVGGDYFDVLKYDEKVYFGIGDVAGHGLESGVIMIMVQTAIRTLLEYGEKDLVKIYSTVNRILYNNMKRIKANKILTLLIASIKGEKVSIVGFHDDPFVIRDRGIIERLDTTGKGIAIGLRPEIDHLVNSIDIQLKPGDNLILFTDGITEARIAKNDYYGVERLENVIKANWNKSANEIKDIVIGEVKKSIGSGKMYDDISLLVIKLPKNGS